MNIDRRARVERFDLVTDLLGLQSVAARVTAGKDLHTEPVDLIALHQLLSGVDSVGRNGCRLSLDCRLSLICRGQPFWLFLMVCSSSVVFCLFLRNRWDCQAGFAVHEIVDGFLLSNGYFAFTAIALLDSLGENRLCIDCCDAADTQYAYDE